MQDDAAFGGRVQADLFGMRAAAGPFDVAGQAAAVEQAFLLGRLLARGKAVPVGQLGGALQHVRERAGVIDLADRVGVGQLRGLDVIHLADGARVHADLARGGVHQPLDDEHAFGPARAAIGADRRGVGHHSLDVVMHQRQVIDAGLHERPEHQRNDGAGAGEIGAGAAERAHPIGLHAAFGVEREFAGRGQVAAMGAADEIVGAVAAPAHLAPEFDRGIGDDAVFRIEAGLLAKTAADIADQHPDAFLRPLQHGFGEQIAGRARRLRLHVQDQPAGFLVDLGNGRARLHRRRHQPLADQIERDHMRGLGERRFDRGRIAIAHRGGDIVGRLGPYRRRARLDRRDGIDHRGQHFIFDRDRFGRALRRDPRRRHHGRDRFAGKAHDLMRQQPARRRRHRRAVGPLENQQRRQGADIVGDQVGAGIDRFDTRHRRGGLGVDREDVGMGMRRAQHIQPQRAVFRLVVDELPLPGQKPLVFKTLDRLACTETHIAGKNIHQFVLRVFCSIWRVLADRQGTGQAHATVIPGSRRSETRNLDDLG